MGIFNTSITPDDNISPNEEGQEIINGAEEIENEELDNEELDQEEIDGEVLDPNDDNDEGQVETKPNKTFDIEKAYSELRKDYTKKTQELSDLKKQRSTPPQGQELDEDTFFELLNSKREGLIDERARDIAWQMVAPLYEQRSAEVYNNNVSELAEAYPELETEDGYKEFINNLYQVAEEMGNPGLVNNPPKKLLKMAAVETFGESTAKVYEKAKQKGKQEVLESIQAKKGLPGPTGAKKQQQTKTIEEEIADSIVNAGRRGSIFG